MKQIEGVFSWEEAKKYTDKVIVYLRSLLSMETYLESIRKKKEMLEKVSLEKGKKAALMMYDGKEYSDYDSAFDSYMEQLETDLYRAANFYNQIMSGFDRIPDKDVRGAVYCYYVEGCTLEQAEEKLQMSISNLSSKKKIGLARIAEQLFGIVIDV